MSESINGNVDSFDKNWSERYEAGYTHWTRGEPKNQIQLAFRNHWTFFNELMQNPNFNGGKRVLEVGCGRGTLSCYFSDSGYRCTLLDMSEKAILLAREIFLQNKLSGNFQVGDTMALPFKGSSFDIVFSIGLLEHFEDIRTPIIEQIRVLYKGGLFISYVVPKYTNNVQTNYEWINEILKGYAAQHSASQFEKEEVFRSDLGSTAYLPILKEYGLNGVQASGVYPLPMISHSVEFPFTLMPPESERALVSYLKTLLEKNYQQTGKHPWLCDEGYGQAFLVWGYKK